MTNPLTALLSGYVGYENARLNSRDRERQASLEAQKRQQEEARQAAEMAYMASQTRHLDAETGYLGQRGGLESAENDARILNTLREEAQNAPTPELAQEAWARYNDFFRSRIQKAATLPGMPPTPGAPPPAPASPAGNFTSLLASPIAAITGGPAHGMPPVPAPSPISALPTPPQASYGPPSGGSTHPSSPVSPGYNPQGYAASPGEGPTESMANTQQLARLGMGYAQNLTGADPKFIYPSMIETLTKLAGLNKSADDARAASDKTFLDMGEYQTKEGLRGPQIAQAEAEATKLRLGNSKAAIELPYTKAATEADIQATRALRDERKAMAQNPALALRRQEFFENRVFPAQAALWDAQGQAALARANAPSTPGVAGMMLEYGWVLDPETNTIYMPNKAGMDEYEFNLKMAQDWAQAMTDPMQRAMLQKGIQDQDPTVLMWQSRARLGASQQRPSPYTKAPVQPPKGSIVTPQVKAGAHGTVGGMVKPSRPTPNADARRQRAVAPIGGSPKDPQNTRKINRPKR